MAKKTLGVIGGVVKALLKRRVAGDPPTEFKVKRNYYLELKIGAARDETWKIPW